MLSHFKITFHKYETLAIELIEFVGRFVSSAYTMINHDQYKWVEPKELFRLKLAPADIPIAEALVSQNGTLEAFFRS